MTMPDERTRALVHTLYFLESLLDRSVTPRVPQAVRKKAGRLLRHYPTLAAIDMAHMTCPHLYGPVAPYLRQPGGRAPLTSTIRSANGHPALTH